MLRKLRRSSKEPPEEYILIVKDDESRAVVLDEVTEEGEHRPRLSFFDLPAEIRNNIYEFVIADTTLSLPSSLFATGKKLRLPLKRRKSCPTPINGLLLASRQCRREYLSTLFSYGSIVVEVKDFDFDGLIKASSSLDELEIQSLKTNRNLTVQLMTQNCRPKDALALRKWLDHRKDSEINLPWKYDFPLNKLLPPTKMGRLRLMKELEYYAENISLFEAELEESQREELNLIREAFRSKIEWLEGDLDILCQRTNTAWRNLRGLAGGGVY